MQKTEKSLVFRAWKPEIHIKYWVLKKKKKKAN